MANLVPDTNTFNLKDVTQVIYGVSTGSLRDSFASSISIGFDSRYVGSKNNLYNFRNYWVGTMLSQTPFIAPVDFVNSSQPVDIVREYSKFVSGPGTAYWNASDARYIFSVSDDVTSTPAVDTSYWSVVRVEQIDGNSIYTPINWSSIPWTAGSTKRYVIGLKGSSDIVTAFIPNGAIWAYIGNKCNSILATNAVSLKYIHCQDLQSITIFPESAFSGCSILQGVCNYPKISEVPRNCFYSCIGITRMILQKETIGARDLSFSFCQFSRLDIYRQTYPLGLNPSSFDNFSFYNCTVHIPTGMNTGLYTMEIWFGQHVWTLMGGGIVPDL